LDHLAVCGLGECVAKQLQLLTWYTWLQGEPLTIPGAIFIFGLYPGMFGALVYLFKRIERQ